MAERVTQEMDGAALPGGTQQLDLLVQPTPQPRDGVLGDPGQPQASTSRSTLPVELPLT
jgi:hypothetical protein